MAQGTMYRSGPPTPDRKWQCWGIFSADWKTLRLTAVQFVAEWIIHSSVPVCDLQQNWYDAVDRH